MPDITVQLPGGSADAQTARNAAIRAAASAAEASATLASKAPLASPDLTGNPRVMSGATPLITMGRGAGIYETVVYRSDNGAMSLARTDGHWGYGQAATTLALSANMDVLAQVCGGYVNGTLGDGGPADYLSSGWGVDSVVVLANNYLKPMGAAGVAETSMQAPAASYTATTVTLSPVLTTGQVGRLRAGMLLRTSDGHVGMLQSWTAAVLTVDAWSLRPDKTPGQVASGDTLYINPIGKAWAANFNVDVRAQSQGPTPGACALEASIRNQWGADTAKQMWAVDAVNLGAFTISSLFIARGIAQVAYRARAGTEAAFLADDTPASAMASDSFKTYRSSGGAFVVFQGSTGTRYRVDAATGGVDMGARGAGVATAPQLRFFTTGDVGSVPDSRIVPSGGAAGTADAGILSYYAGTHRLYVGGGTTQGLLVQTNGAGETRIATPNTSTQALSLDASAIAIDGPLITRGVVELGSATFGGSIRGHFATETQPWQWWMTTPALDTWRVTGDSGWQLNASAAGFTVTPGLIVASGQIELGNASATGYLDLHRSGEAGGTDYQVRLGTSALDVFRMTGASGWTMDIGAAGIVLPARGTAGRPVSPAEGTVARNTDTGRIEHYQSGAWRGWARLDGDAFTGPVTMPTPAASDAPQRAATVGFVLAQNGNTAIPVGNAGMTLPSTDGTDTTNNSLNSRSQRWAPASGDITDLQVGAPAFQLNVADEQDIAQSYTLWASVEYPIGTTPRRIFWDGAASVTVTPGRTMRLSDPVGTFIPRGAAFAIKAFVTWTTGAFPLRASDAVRLIGDWTTRGTGLSDNTLNLTTLTTTGATNGFSLPLFGRYNGPPVMIGLLGDSIGHAAADYMHDLTGQLSWGRFVRNVHPFVNVARGGDTMAGFLARPDGRNHLLRRCSHIVMEMGSNDCYSGASLATVQDRYRQVIGGMLARGQRVYGNTIPPRTTSTDNWMTAINQTLVNPAANTVRIGFNDWLRANWASLGLSALFDIAAALEPDSNGLWGVDAGGYSCTSGAYQIATLTNGVVTGLAFRAMNSLGSDGDGFLPNQTGLNAIISAFPGTTGSGATATFNTNASGTGGTGRASAFTLTNGGSGYSHPPLVSTPGNWTADGVHPSARGLHRALIAADFGPHRFTP